jgi:hypothetical protein
VFQLQCRVLDGTCQSRWFPITHESQTADADLLPYLRTCVENEASFRLHEEAAKREYKVVWVPKKEGK